MGNIQHVRIRDNTMDSVPALHPEMCIRDSHTVLNRNNREQLIAVVAAMSYVENGVPANMDEVRKGWELI